MVDFDFEVEEIVEGKARILVPKTTRGKGPGKKEGVPFYNPVMEPNRDISVLVLQNCLSSGKNRILDGLAGTGIRGIRFAMEVSGNLSILMNDWNEQSHAIMLENIRRNEAQNTEVRHEDLNTLLTSDEFDYLDVDPYGTPVPFLDKAVKGVRDGGILAVTATDTAALAGSSPKACMRKYGATPIKSKTSHETGLRILVGYCARIAAEYDLNIRPLLSHSTDHYYRTYLEIQQGQSQANGTRENVGFLSVDLSSQEMFLEEEKKDDFVAAGPLWIGSLWNPGFLEEMRSRSYMPSETSRILELLKLESQIESPYHSSEEIASHLKVHTPRLASILERLNEEGYNASPTHFDSKGFRTNAPIDEILQIFKKT
ncbi:MAG: tRNA (guanine(10)-N(2))-dimethyltransferase [Methanobacteriota archaeon]|nr:MAG: tRNA (guanine(10)-N(2))-dimethyltransferase [Euryarchaeota archaeon]